MTPPFTELRDFLGATFYQGWRSDRDCASAVDAFVGRNTPAVLLRIAGQLEALLREDAPEDALVELLIDELYCADSPWEPEPGPRGWLAGLARSLRGGAGPHRLVM